MTSRRTEALLFSQNTTHADAMAQGVETRGRGRGRTKERRHRIDWFGEGRAGARTHGGQEKRILNKREKNREGIPKETRRPCRGLGKPLTATSVKFATTSARFDYLSVIIVAKTRGGQHYRFLTIKIFHFSLHRRNSYLGFRRC